MVASWRASKLPVAGRLGKSKGNMPEPWKKVAALGGRGGEIDKA